MAVSTPWTQVTPTWYDSLQGAAVGNGTLGLRYRREGSRLTWAFLLRVGSTTNTGSDSMAFSFPLLVPPIAFSSVSGQWSEWLGAAYAWDNSAARMYAGSARISSDIPVSDPDWSQVFPPNRFYLMFWFGQNAQLASASVPFTWAVGDRLTATGTVEAFDN